MDSNRITVVILVAMVFLYMLVQSVTGDRKGVGTDHIGTSTVDVLSVTQAKVAVHMAKNLSALVTETLGQQQHVSGWNERAAWRDCMELYEDTVVQLNQAALLITTINTSSQFVDFQTWLSAALTNLETCKDGLAEAEAESEAEPEPDQLGQINEASFDHHLMAATNLSKLISSSLAMISCGHHRQYLEGESSIIERQLIYNQKDGFPVWVSTQDRKLLQSSTSTVDAEADIVVSKDGWGDYKTVKMALKAAGKMRKKSFRTRRIVIIRVKKGIYKENLDIGRKLKNIMLVGDGLRSTIITGHRSVAGGYTTFRSATVAVKGNGFIARGITFRNSAGPHKHQAVALRSSSDHSIYYECGFEGYQDTLYVRSHRQFYRDCDIYGTVDFIFGNAAAIFQHCNIYPRKPLPNQKNTITAQGRTDPNQNTGIVIHRSNILTPPGLQQGKLNAVRTYLGRPWKKYSRTVVMKTRLDRIVDPAGWLDWDGKSALKTLYYAEYDNSGPGASTGKRVKWDGFKLITSEREASRFTIDNFIQGNSWLPGYGVPFTVGI